MVTYLDVKCVIRGRKSDLTDPSASFALACRFHVSQGASELLRLETRPVS